MMRSWFILRKYTSILLEGPRKKIQSQQLIPRLRFEPRVFHKGNNIEFCEISWSALLSYNCSIPNLFRPSWVRKLTACTYLKLLIPTSPFFFFFCSFSSTFRFISSFHLPSTCLHTFCLHSICISSCM